MRRFLKSNGNLRTIVVAGIVATVCGGSAAVAGTLVTSQDIQDGTIKPVDISKKLRKKIYSKSGTLAAAVPGQAGANGTNGVNGSDGAAGAAGADAEYEAGNWGVILRNTIGSAIGELRPGPFGSFGVTGAAGEPPFGEGSVGLQVKDGTEKVAFGNEVDFFGDDPTAIDEVGFQVFQTGESCGFSGGVCTTPRNMPNITFELDPNVGGASNAVNYTSLVYVPDGVPAAERDRWSAYIDATATGGDWYFTNGTLGTQTGCNQTTYCDWDQVKTALNDAGNTAAAAIYTVAVGKGRDSAWVGAVDGLRLGDTIYDFEPLGVEEIPAS